MKLLAILSICIVISKADMEKERLINAVITADYSTAVAKSLELEAQSNGRTIKDAVSRLIKDANRNVLDFAYKLWISNGQEIVKNYFPIQIQQILSESKVKIINVRDNLAIKLGSATDSVNDRTGYGDANDKTSENVSWKIIPLWDDRVYFKIYNLRRHQYLKVEVKADYANDHAAFGANDSNTYRHQWYLIPTKLHDKMVFFIYNREYGQALKLSRAVDYAGDRQLFSHNGNVDGQPELFGWTIVSN